MNRDNNTMLTSPNLNYTSRDYSSIYNELLNSIPLLTKEWEPKDENDPGVVLLKLMSMTADMLSYNQDKMALETFARTVLQRANAQQIFRVVGYKMHWWRSAMVEARFTNANTFPVIIGRYNTFTTGDNKITYTNTSQLEIPSGSYGVDSYTAELIQGTPVTPIIKGSIKPTDYNAAWHDCYDYNVSSSDFVNNRLYIKYDNIDETSITLIDNDETPFANNEWKLVKNINLSETMDKVFEFDVDENNTPFIVLPNYWKEKFVITKFKLFFVLSNGKSGEIEENTLNKINPSKCYVSQDNVDISSVLSQVNIFNTASTYGYNPQTCTEAREDAEKYVNTLDTLVILKDFEKAVRRIDSVANVIATDIQTDPYPDDMKTNQINLWIIRKSDYNNAGSNYIYAENDENVNEIFKENIVGELKSYKLMPYDLNVNLENKVNWIDWSVTGQIYLRKPINADENYDLLVRINDNLKNRFNCETLDFNEPVNYMDVIECIMKTDKNIWHVDLDTSAIEYSKVKRSIKGNPTGKSLKTKYMIYDKNHSYTGYYMTSLGCTSYEISRLESFTDVYNDVNNGITLESGYLPGNGSLNNSINITTLTDTSAPGGDGYGMNRGNKIVREDGLEQVIGIDFGRPDEPREYEIYNKRIYDWSGYEPVFTGYIIDTSTNPYTVKRYDDYGNLKNTDYTIECDSRMYSELNGDINRYLKDNYRQISDLCTDLSDVYTESDLKKLSDEEKNDLVSKGKLRRVWDIMDKTYDSWTGESIDKESGAIYILRGSNWYITNESYDEASGNILDTFGPVQYTENMQVIREPACREDITNEYIQTYDVSVIQSNPDKDPTEYEFYLGQDAHGEALRDSIGNIINAFPIKPYSLYIYIDGDTELISDNGTGKLVGTPGILNGCGTIDYSTGLVSFKLNVIPASMKIMYKVNKFAYSNYVNFDPATLFVRPEYLRTNSRK